MAKIMYRYSIDDSWKNANLSVNIKNEQSVKVLFYNLLFRSARLEGFSFPLSSRGTGMGPCRGTICLVTKATLLFEKSCKPKKTTKVSK